MKVRIVVDSAADIKDSIRERVSIVPLTVTFGQEEYLDGITITHHQFYEKLIESDVLPTTSQATPTAFTEVFAQAAEAGESVVCVTVSSKLSGTYQSAVIAAQDFENIYVVDSKSAAIGEGILAELALAQADNGLSAHQIACRLEQDRENIVVIAMLDTLEYLKKGGRISKTVAFAGGLLNIKPVVCLRRGEIIMLGKARGSKQGNNLLVSEIERSGGVDFSRPILLGYTGLTDVYLRKYIEDSSRLWQGKTQQLATAIIGSVIGTHVGPGAIAAAFYRKEQ